MMISSVQRGENANNAHLASSMARRRRLTRRKRTMEAHYRHAPSPLWRGGIIGTEITAQHNTSSLGHSKWAFDGILLMLAHRHLVDDAAA